MKTCEYCHKLYDEKEYDYSNIIPDVSNFCCLTHYANADRTLFNRFKMNINALTPKEAYFEIIRGSEDLDIKSTIICLEIISHNKSIVKQLMHHTSLLSRFYLDEYIFMLEKFPIEYTKQILNLMHTSYKNWFIINSLTDMLDSMSKDKREILETFIVLCRLEE